MSRNFRSSALGRGRAIALLLPLAACGGDWGTIDEERVASSPVKPVVIGVSSAERFGGMPSARPEGARPENPLTWTTPADWRAVAPRSSFRLADFELAGDPRAECYLSILPGGGGGLLANVNRWYAQMGAAPLSNEELSRLPAVPLLGSPAPLVRLDGDFAGMVGEPLVDARLLGLVFEATATADAPGFTLFVKCTGPRAVLEAQEDAFFAFASSIRFREGVADPGSGSASTGVPFEGTSRAPDPPGAQRGASPAVPSGAGSGGAGGFEPGQPLPPGWSLGPDKPMRMMTVVTPAGEISVSAAGGGLAQNVSRWYGQMGLQPPSADALLALPTIPMLGTTATLVDLRGDFAGMGAAATPDARLVGVVCPLAGGQLLFVKLVGPAAAVGTEYFRLIAFAQSLRPSEGR